MIIGHGGNTHEIALRLGCTPADIMDMSSNMNPMGPLPGLMAHLTKRLTNLTTLPQADARDCVAAFARRYGLSEPCVLAANGTTQFIYTLPLAMNIRRALIVGPTYADYADACRMHGVEHRFFLTRAADAFHPDMARLREIIPQVDTVFICNPNNPTGALIPREELISLCAYFPEKRFVIDESYMPFVGGRRNFTMADMGMPHLIVLNSMSKIFRIPGLRIGFLIAGSRAAERIRRYLMPWNVNSLAQTAILYLMEQAGAVERFIADTHRFLEGEMQYLHRSLAKTDAIRLFPSATSFVLARVREPHTADSVLHLALSHRILLRNCANFIGLNGSYIRISLKKHGTNALLTDLLKTLGADGITAACNPSDVKAAVHG